MPMTAIQAIRKYAPHFQAKVGITLGSGQSDIAHAIEQQICIPYSEIPGVPVTTVSGHKSQLILGYLQGVPVACLQGRLHRYEGASSTEMKVLIRCLKLLGCESVLMTNASGSLRADVGPGSIVLVKDHINFQPTNPLVGPNDESFGPRFLGMEDAYDIELRDGLHATAKQLGIHTHEGVYISVLGPTFETPAEIRAFRMWGADLVGMSTVPEVIIARHCGMKVAVIAMITNLAAGMTDAILSHEHTLHHATAHADKLASLVTHFVKNAFSNQKTPVCC